MAFQTMCSISIAIPTYGRDQVLIETVQALLNLSSPACNLLVIDQSPFHSIETERQLEQWQKLHKIDWVRRDRPSIVGAMNDALRRVDTQLVLFLDDDIIPISELVEVHQRAHTNDSDLWATVGQVIQPWQQPASILPARKMFGLRTDWDFPFNSTIDNDVQNVMAGNLCVHRERTLSIGCFDENFVGSAFRFETEFARRVGNAGGKVRFLGNAGIRHLRVPSGGTRSTGSHLTSASPLHGQGDYYYAFLHGWPLEKWIYSLRRIVREVLTKFHATHPWWIPVKLVGELRAMWGGWKMARKKRGG